MELDKEVVVETLRVGSLPAAEVATELVELRSSLANAKAEYAVLAKDYDELKGRIRHLEGLLRHARIRIRFMSGVLLSREEDIRSNARLSGAAYIRASRLEKEYRDVLKLFSQWLSASFHLAVKVLGKEEFNHLLLSGRPYTELHEKTIGKLGEMRKGLGCVVRCQPIGDGDYHHAPDCPKRGGGK